MDWDKLRKKHDKRPVLPWLRGLSDQIIEAVYYGKKFKPKKRKIDKIVACGMGGSGIGSEIIKSLLKSELKVPFEAFQTYDLPAYVDSKTLVFCVSFSGNTEETISCFRQAKKKRAYVIAIATGGKLKGLAKKDCIVIPNASPQPRMAVAYTSLPMLIVLERMKLVAKKNNELNEAVFLLKKEERQLEAKAKELALKMRNKLPVIYASEELSCIAYKFRTDINENAKQLALHHFLPEQNHNEINAMLGLTRKDAEIFLLRHGKEHKRVEKRFRILKKIMGKHYNVNEVNLKGRSLAAIIFYGLQLAALTAYYLALANNANPELIPSIKLLKKELKK